MKIEFDQEKHIYRFGGKRVPNVTSLLAEYGLINFDGVPKHRLTFKSALGIAVHYAIQLHNEHNLDENSLHESIKPYFMAYKKFAEVYKFEPRHTELRMHSKKWGFAGTLDAQGLFFWKKKEIEAIIDWKCSWGLYPANGPQTAAYQLAFEDNYPDIKIKGRFALQLKETGNYEIVEYVDLTDKNTFLAALHLHSWRIRHGLIKQGSENGNNI